MADHPGQGSQPGLYTPGDTTNHTHYFAVSNRYKIYTENFCSIVRNGTFTSETSERLYEMVINSNHGSSWPGKGKNISVVLCGANKIFSVGILG